MRTKNLEVPFIEAIFREYWEQDNGAIGEYSELRKIAHHLGVDPDEFEALCESNEIRQQLIDSTNTAQANGVFGAPSMRLAGELYWGKDRMAFIEDQLKQLTSDRSNDNRN